MKVRLPADPVMSHQTASTLWYSLPQSDLLLCGSKLTLRLTSTFHFEILTTLLMRSTSIRPTAMSLVAAISTLRKLQVEIRNSTGLLKAHWSHSMKAFYDFPLLYLLHTPAQLPRLSIFPAQAPLARLVRYRADARSHT